MYGPLKSPHEIQTEVSFQTDGVQIPNIKNRAPYLGTNKMKAKIKQKHAYKNNNGNN